MSVGKKERGREGKSLMSRARAPGGDCPDHQPSIYFRRVSASSRLLQPQHTSPSVLSVLNISSVPTGYTNPCASARLTRAKQLQTIYGWTSEHRPKFTSTPRSLEASKATYNSSSQTRVALLVPVDWQ
jgi:hypothetical protein